jgi:hypothetical protein
MEQEKNAFLEVFRKLDPENRADVLAHVHVAYAAQEHTKRHYGIEGPDVPPFNGASPTPAA